MIEPFESVGIKFPAIQTGILLEHERAADVCGWVAISTYVFGRDPRQAWLFFVRQSEQDSTGIPVHGVVFGRRKIEALMKLHAVQRQ